MPIDPVELKPIKLFSTTIGLDEQNEGFSVPSNCIDRHISNEEMEDESEMATKVHSCVENPIEDSISQVGLSSTNPSGQYTGSGF